MDSGTRLVKTAKGREEIEHRRYKLASKMRTLLILVDGARSIDNLTSDGRKLGAPDEALILLMKDGFVAPVTGAAAPAAVAAAVAPGAIEGGGAVPAMDEFAQFRAAHKFMNDTAVDNMGGLKKFTFTLKLERCSSRTELAGLIPDYGESLSKAVGSDAAQVLVTRLRAMLT